MEINMDYSTICTINNLPKPKNATTEAIFDAKKKRGIFQKKGGEKMEGYFVDL